MTDIDGLRERKDACADLVARFLARAQAASVRVDVVADEAAAEDLIAADRTARAARQEQVGVARAAKGIAETGTCVVVTTDEETRLATMLPETSVILLRTADIVADLPDLAPFLREQQQAVSYVSFITGPSRTADIERVGAIGVHGPLELHVILLEGVA